MNFAQILTTIMEQKKISAYKMSKETGISDSLIGYWKKGERVPNAENLIILSKYLNVSIDYLLTGSKNDISTIDVSSIGIIGNHNETGSLIINQPPLEVNSIKPKLEDTEPDELTSEMTRLFSKLTIQEKISLVQSLYEKENKR